MNKQLHQYQVEGIQFLSEKKKAILADDMGLGKTAQALRSASLPVLVICPNFAMDVWLDEIADWLGECVITVYRGTQEERMTLLRKKIPISDFVITNYTLMQELSRYDMNFATVIFDEAHKLRNRTTKTLFPIAREYAKIADKAFFLTGTPVIKGAQDLWTLLHMCDPWKFMSYWRFVQRYCLVYDNGFGHVVEGTNPAHANELVELAKQYILQRTKEQVKLELPEKRRQRITVHLDKTVQEWYNELTEEMVLIAESQDKVILTPNKLAQSMRLRQMLVSPKLLGLDGKSAPIEAVKEDLLGYNKPVVIFTPFREAIPIIGEEIQAAGYDYVQISGKVSPLQFSKNMAKFRKGGKIALIATLAMGQSWSAANASIAYMIGFDWSPEVHYQSEARLHRIGQENKVLIKYFLHRNTIEEHVLDVLTQKVTWEQLFSNPNRLLKRKVRIRTDG